MSTYRLLQGDCVARLRDLPADSVQCVVTSPPYWGLRDYGVEGQIGLESSPEYFTAALVGVFQEVRRVLRPDGTCWVNLGDCYAQSGRGGVGDSSTLNGSRHSQNESRKALASIGRLMPEGLKAKDLIGIPWRVAFALQADGWWLRSDIIWAKPNPMPESVTDRPTKSHEYVFLLSKAERYFYDSAAIAEVITHPEDATPDDVARAFTRRRESTPTPRQAAAKPPRKNEQTGNPQRHGFNARWDEAEASGAAKPMRNRRTVWTVATQPFPGAHFATFPEDLVRPCILAGSRAGDTVLDPFNGSGTTGVVALKQGRSYVGIDLNPDYIEMSRRRLASVAPLLAREVA